MYSSFHLLKGWRWGSSNIFESLKLEMNKSATAPIIPLIRYYFYGLIETKFRLWKENEIWTWNLQNFISSWNWLYRTSSWAKFFILSRTLLYACKSYCLSVVLQINFMFLQGNQFKYCSLSKTRKTLTLKLWNFVEVYSLENNI